jgi:hypothetical protein
LGRFWNFEKKKVFGLGSLSPTVPKRFPAPPQLPLPSILIGRKYGRKNGHKSAPRLALTHPTLLYQHLLANAGEHKMSRGEL